ncbi:MAG: thermonuclease family protein [Deltaproteobacteria bacterium]|nr:thermonuclease family protein [Deltaproteobacteria bacterium]
MKQIFNLLFIFSALLIGMALGVVEKENIIEILGGYFGSPNTSQEGSSPTSGGTTPTTTTTTVNDGSAIQLIRVIRVIDGDTVELEGGDRVRYVGVDTPERGDPFFDEATNRNRELVEGQIIALKICAGEPKDHYGRWLGWVYKGPSLVNAELIREGLGYLMIIPPCGLDKVSDLTQAHLQAQQQHFGLWSNHEQLE